MKNVSCPAFFDKPKRLLIYAGHYGSGKTTLAVNTAMCLARRGMRVIMLDLDIVNPYFRSTDSADLFARAGVRLISPAFVNTNVEAPALPPDMYAAFDDRGAHVVIDVGGDDAGAAALGRFADRLAAESVEMILTVNCYRAFTKDAESAEMLMRSIEAAARRPFSAIASNHNLGRETTTKTVRDGLAMTEALSARTGLPVVLNAVKAELAAELADIANVFPVHIYTKTAWHLFDEEPGII